jgi:XTP/dITP diphosphohydrolase
MAATILLASTNPYKHGELAELLEPYRIVVRTPSDLGLVLEVEENGSTFAENALIKARAFCAAAGMTSLADDSGLVVDALGGEPGVLSARYGGAGLTDEDRTALVLKRMRGIPDQMRGGRFVAAVAIALPHQEPKVFEGRVEGRITTEPAGACGFGYDPIFFYEPAGRTFAQMSRAKKSRVSHRGRALRPAAVYLQRLAEDGILP